jgi:hypothetical protein
MLLSLDLSRSEDSSLVPKLPHSIPKGELLSHALSSIVILNEEIRKVRQLAKEFEKSIDGSNIERISRFYLKGGANQSIHRIEIESGEVYSLHSPDDIPSGSDRA